MRTFSNKKILIGFSDPGGAKPLLAFAEQHQFNDLLIISDREYPFYTDFSSKVIKVQITNLPEIVKNFKPDEIITGTSYPSLFEKELLQIALKAQIFCIAYIDHYTRINDRFLLENGLLIQPNEVWVIDEEAEKKAKESLLKQNTIKISGNPYHQWLKKWKPKLNKESFLAQYNISTPKHKSILFAPDPLSNINGMEKYGFDELSVIEELKKLFDDNRDLADNFVIWIKPHPNQNIHLMEKILIGQDNLQLISHTIDTNTIIYYADYIMGFFSSILIEASILGKKLIRYLPNAENDPFKTKTHFQVLDKNTFVAHALSLI